MSGYANLANKVFTDRYARTSGWFSSSVPEDAMPANRPIDARIALILHPGSVINQNGWFTNVDIGRWPNGAPVDALSLSGMGFRLPSMGWEGRVITKGEYQNTSAWFRREWSIDDLVAAGMDPAYADLLRTARSIYTRIVDTIDWIPSSLAVRWDRAMAAGGLPFLLRTNTLIQENGVLPDFLLTPARQEAWNALATQLGRIQSQVNAANLESLQQEAKRLASSVAFWDTVAAYSGADALYGKWEELKDAIRTFNKRKMIIEDNVRTINALVAAAPDAFNFMEQAEGIRIKQESDGLSAQAQATLSGPVMSALRDEGMNIQGLGAIGPVVLIGMGVTAVVVAGATTAFLGYVTAQALLTNASNARVHEFAMTREDFDNTAYEREQMAIREQESRLNELLLSAQISPTDFDRQMADLNQRAQAAGVALVKRREQTSQAVDLYNTNMKKASEGVAADFLSSAKWIAIAGAVGIFALFAMPRIAAKK